MKKNISLYFVLLFIGLSPLFADLSKGEQIYVKYLQPNCKNMSAGSFSAKHSQDEWEEIFDAGALNSEIKIICKSKGISEKFLPHIYDFVYEYANDSGKVPHIK